MACACCTPYQTVIENEQVEEAEEAGDNRMNVEDRATPEKDTQATSVAAAGRNFDALAMM